MPTGPRVVYFGDGLSKSFLTIPAPVRLTVHETFTATSGKRAVTRDAFDRLLVQHLPAALGMAVKLTGDVQAAEDVTHDAVVRATRAWQGFRGEAKFSTWWLAIVINVWRDHQRRRPWHALPTGVDVPGGAATPGQSAEAGELAVRVAECVSALPPRQREVVVLVACEGQTLAEAAAVLGISEGNVRTNLSLGRKALKEKLARYL